MNALVRIAATAGVLCSTWTATDVLAQCTSPVKVSITGVSGSTTPFGSAGVVGVDCNVPQSKIGLGCPPETVSCNIQCGNTSRTLQASGSLSATGVPCPAGGSVFENVSSVQASAHSTATVGNGCTGIAFCDVTFTITALEPTQFNIAINKSLVHSGQVKSGRSFLRVSQSSGLGQGKLCEELCNISPCGCDPIGGPQNSLITSGLLPPGGSLVLFITVESHLTAEDKLNLPGAQNTSATGTASVELTVSLNSPGEPPAPETTFSWFSPVGGLYAESQNWFPECGAPPRHDGQRSDTAEFLSVDVNPLPVNVSGATAKRWVVSGLFETSGNAQLFSTDVVPASLEVVGPGKLRHVSGTLTSVNTRLGAGGSGSAQLGIANTGTTWVNSGDLFVGLDQPAEVAIENATVESGNVFLGGGSGNGPGTLTLQGSAAAWSAPSIGVGSTTDAGTLNIKDGALLTTQDPSSVDAPTALAGTVSVSGQAANGTGSKWIHHDVLEVGAVGRGDVHVENGASLTVDELKLGRETGSSGNVHVRGVSGNAASLLDVATSIHVGNDQGGGLLEVLDGAYAVADELIVGCDGNGSVLVSGSSNPGDLSDLSAFAILEATSSIVAGCDNSSGGNGAVTVNNGGAVHAPRISVTGSGGSGKGQIVVDGQGGRAVLNVLECLEVDAMEIVEVEVKNGAEIFAHDVQLGVNPVRPGAGEITIRGSGSGRSRLVVGDDPSGAPAKTTVVGAFVEGELNILDGATAELGGGLTIGSLGRGAVVASNLNEPGALHLTPATLTVRGQTLVGSLAPAFLNVQEGATMLCEGDLKVGFAAPGDSTAVTIKGPGGGVNIEKQVDVNGTIAIGFNRAGDMSLDQFATVECDLLLVGGPTALADGDMRLLDGILRVTGNAQIGVGLGSGSMLIQTRSQVQIDGTMTVGGPGIGNVTVHGRIVGLGLVRAVPGGIVNGSGRITARKVENGGTIAPNLSPGTLTIEGDYEQFEDGVLEIEVAGLEPGQFDVLHITGNATLAGTVDLKFIDGFVPKPGDSVDFVKVDGTITGKLTGSSLIDAADGAAQAEVTWEVTEDGTCRMTVTRVTFADALENLLAGCGAGLCGAGAAPLLPLTVVGLATLKITRRRRAR